VFLLLLPQSTQDGSRSDFDGKNAGVAMDELKIERFGGLAGMGLPGSRIKSRGQVAVSSLSAADRTAIDALFAGKAKPEPALPDAFSYRITRHTAQGLKTIEVPGHRVPLALQNSVVDELE
jgi:hypothetical protein